MTEQDDAQFLRAMAHQAEIGDPIEKADWERMRAIADKIDVRPQPKYVLCHRQHHKGVACPDKFCTWNY